MGSDLLFIGIYKILYIIEQEKQIWEYQICFSFFYNTMAVVMIFS